MLLAALLRVNCSGAPKNGAAQEPASAVTASQEAVASVEPVAIVPIFDADSAYS